MYNSRAGVVYGFHGCDISVYNQLIAGEKQKESTNDYDWLGHGCYFWENDPYRAYEFAKELVSRGKAKEPAVIGAVIDYGYCLDFTTRYAVNLLIKAHEEFIKYVKRNNLSMPVNSGGDDNIFRRLDCAVIQHLHIGFKVMGLNPFDTVRAPFTEGKEAYPNSGFRIKNHIQICVRNNGCIKGYFKPRIDYTEYND